MATVADLTAMLKLNNANFKSGLKGAERALNGFKKQVSVIKSSIIGALAIGGAAATFKKAIASTQETNDKFVAAMEAANQATTQLLAAIATGDFSGLIDNMRNAAKAGKEFADAMDEVSDRSRSVRIQTALAEKNIYKLREVATDTARTDAERIVAYKEVLKLTSQQIEAERIIANDALEAQIQKQITRNNLTKEQGQLIKDFVTNYEQLTGSELSSVRNVKTLKSEWERLEKRISQLSQQGVTGDILKQAAVEADAAKLKYEKVLGSLSDMELKYWDIDDALNKMTDAERDAIAQLIIDGAKLEQKLQSLQNEAVRGVGSIETKAKNAKKATDGLADSLDNLSDEWMSTPFNTKGIDFGKNATNVGGIIVSDETAKKAQANLQMISDGMAEFSDEAAEEAQSLGATVGYMLVNQFDALGEAIGKAMSGAKDAIKELGIAILQNLGNILIMAGISAGFPAGLPLVIAGAAIQLGGGIFKGLGSGSPDLSRGGAMVGGDVNFRISGKDLVGTLDRQSYANGMNT